jgi:amino acid transporter
LEAGASGMRYAKQKLALFFTVQALAVAAMIYLCQAARDPECALVHDCAAPPAASLLLSISMLLGELAVVARVLRHDQPVWHALVGLAFVSLFTALVFALGAVGTNPSRDMSLVLAIWHVVVGLILLAAGAAAAFWRLLEKLRRSDTLLADDLQSSAMWPLD